MSAAGSQQDDTHRTCHAQHQTGDLEAREFIDTEHHGNKQYQQRRDRVDDRSVDGRRAGQTVHEQHLADYADQQGRTDHRFDVLAGDRPGLAPKQRNEREKCRRAKRSGNQRDRGHVLRQHEVVKGIVACPDDVAQQQRQMGLHQKIQRSRLHHTLKKLPPADPATCRTVAVSLHSGQIPCKTQPTNRTLAPKRLGKSDRFGRPPAPRRQQNAGARPHRRIIPDSPIPVLR